MTLAALVLLCLFSVSSASVLVTFTLSEGSTNIAYQALFLSQSAGSVDASYSTVVGLQVQEDEKPTEIGVTVFPVWPCGGSLNFTFGGMSLNESRTTLCNITYASDFPTRRLCVRTYCSVSAVVSPSSDAHCVVDTPVRVSLFGFYFSENGVTILLTTACVVSAVPAFLIAICVRSCVSKHKKIQTKQ